MTTADTLVSRYGTPLYVYDLDEVTAAADRLAAALVRPHSLLYSVKANPHPAVLAHVARLGLAAEVSSEGELERARRAGFTLATITLTGPGKTGAFLAAGVAAGCRISVESAGELDALAEAAGAAGTTARALVRLNLPHRFERAGLSMTGGPSKFGIDLDQVTPGLRRAGVRLVGVHVFQATNIADPASLAGALTAAVAGAREAAESLGLDCDVVDLGGGFPAPYAEPGGPAGLDGLTVPLAGALDHSFPGWRTGEPLVAFESGRYLVATAGTLLTRVLDIKRSGGHRQVIVDAGVNHLGGMSGLRRLPPLRVRPLDDGPHRGPVGPAHLAGPLCTPLDRWPGAEVPTSLRVGDVLAIPNVGAYGLSASLVAFLSHGAPIEVAVAGTEVVAATRLTLDDVAVDPVPVPAGRGVPPC